MDACERNGPTPDDVWYASLRGIGGVRFGFMARHRSLTSQLYRAARTSNNISALASGNPRRVARRARNVAVGRGLGGRRAGVWRQLWK